MKFLGDTIRIPECVDNEIKEKLTSYLQTNITQHVLNSMMDSVMSCLMHAIHTGVIHEDNHDFPPIGFVVVALDTDMMNGSIDVKVEHIDDHRLFNVYQHNDEDKTRGMLLTGGATIRMYYTSENIDYLEMRDLDIGGFFTKNGLTVVRSK